jgi:hypothetical protein
MWEAVCRVSVIPSSVPRGGIRPEALIVDDLGID